MNSKKELQKIAQEIREIKAMLLTSSVIAHYDVEGYFNSVEEYFNAEEVLIKKRLLMDNLNYNDSGSQTGSFSYAVKAKDLQKFEKMVKKLKGTIVSMRAYDKRGNEVEDYD